MSQTLNGITVNKLTLAQYKSAKASSSLNTNEVYVISDIDEQLENLLVYKESLDVNNPIILRSLESGLYKIYGYFKYNSNQTGISGVDPFAYVIIEKVVHYHMQLLLIQQRRLDIQLLIQHIKI